MSIIDNHMYLLDILYSENDRILFLIAPLVSQTKILVA